MATLTKSNLSVIKTLRLIEILARESEPMRLIDLANEAGMPSSTTLRMLHTLAECGYVFQEEKGLQRYGLTMRFMKIGQMAADHFNIRSMVHPYLLDLSQEACESCCVSIEDNFRMRYVDVVENAHSAFVVRQRIGHTSEMYNTGSGKVMLADYTQDELDAYFTQKELKPFTEKTLITRESLMQAVQKGKEDGYFYDDEECEIGIRCVAVPIRGTEQHSVAALSISGIVSHMSITHCETFIIPLLQSYAEQIETQIRGKV